MTQVTWDTTAEPQVESDTLYLLDTDAEALRPAGDDGLMMQNVSAGDLMPWAGTSKIDVVAGKFRTGLRSNTSSQGNCWMPCHGLLPTDEFTLEGWLLADADWSTLTNKFPFGFYIDSGAYARLQIASNLIAFNVLHSQDPVADVNKTVSTAATPLAGTSHHVGVTLKAGSLKLYLDGVLKATTTGVTLPPIFSDKMRQSGLVLCGANANGLTGMTISDFRVSRTARIPGTPVTLRDTNTVTVALGSPRGDTVRKSLLGGLHGVALTETTDVPAAATRVQGLVRTVRTDKFLSVSPIKAGAPDGTHPTAGHSGLYSYDWQVVDRTLDYLATYGFELYLSIDSCPQLLGGTAPPYSGMDLTTLRSAHSTFNSQVPNDFSAFATMAADLLYHITVEKATPVPYADLWNEPNGGFWAGTQTQYLDFYDAVMPAVRAVAPATKLGGPSISQLDPTWVSALIQRCASSGSPLDFISYHDYSGCTAQPNRARQLVERYRTTYSFAGALELIDGEYNATNNADFPGTGQLPWSGLNYATNDFAASVLAGLLMEFQRLDFVRSVWTNIVTDDAGTGYFSTGLVSQTGWRAPGNVFRLWDKLPPRVLNVTVDAVPGLTAISADDPDTGRVAVLLGNCHFRQGADLPVTVSIPGLTGTPTAYLIDDAHSNVADAGGTGDLETVTAPALSGGSMDVTLAPRSVMLLDVAPGGGSAAVPALVKVNGVPALAS